MKKIKISKKQWNALSKKAQAPATAPTKTPVRAPTRTPSTPSPKPKPNIWNPTKPAISPEPKAKIEENKIKEEDTFAGKIDSLVRLARTYEEGAVEPVRNFWSNIPADHPFYHNEVLKEHGGSLSKEGYEHIVGKMEQGGEREPKDMYAASMEAAKVLEEIIQLEADHKEELENEAKQIVSQLLGIPVEIQEADLGVASKPEQTKHKEIPITPKIRGEINKRIVMNTITQGSAVHAMQSIHHLIAEKINNISPELLKLYTRISNVASHHYYIIDVPSIIKAMKGRLGSAAIGWSYVKYDEAGNAKVHAEGKCFPVLCQELFKGAMELLSSYGINKLGKEELGTVLNHADRLEDEPWLIMVGPALWRKFLNVIPKEIQLSDLIKGISEDTPENVQEVVKAVIRNPNVAKQLLQKYLPKEEKEVYEDNVEQSFPEIPDDFGANTPDLPDIPDDFGDEKYFKK